VAGIDDPFSRYIKVKSKAPELFRRALRNRPRDLVYLDGYQPVESKYRYARGMLEVCFDLGFPVFLNEKSPILLRDLDILKKINENSYLNVGWSIITTEDDPTRSHFEANAPPVESRFEAMEILADHNILTGTIFMPILPFIYDYAENIEAVIRKTREAGGEYVLEGGLTLQGYCRDYFYKAIEAYDPKLVASYEWLYEDEERLAGKRAQIHQEILKYCRKYELKHYIPRPVSFYPEELQINREIAGKLYLKAREIQVSKENPQREWAYRRAAWALDDLKESVVRLYRERGVDGLLEIRGVGKSITTQIQGYLDG